MRHRCNSKTVLPGAAAILLCVAAPALAYVQTTSATPTWDLQRQYPTNDAWENDRQRVLNGIAELKRLRRRAAHSASDLADVLDAMRQVRGLAGKMARFGLLESNIDRSSDLARGRYDAGTALEAQVEAAVGPLETEIRSIGEQRVSQWRDEEPRIASFGHTRRLRRIFHEARYGVLPKIQELLANMERWPRTTADTYEALIAGVIEWPTVTDHDGRSFSLTPSEYRTARRSPDKAFRQTAAKEFSSALDKFEPVLGLMFTRRVEAEEAMAKARGFANAAEASFVLRDAVPATAIQQALGAVRQNRSLALRYAQLLARGSGMDRAGYGEALARSPWPLTADYSIAEAQELIIESQANLGPEYAQALRTVYSKPWFHLAPTPNKSGGYGVFIQVGGGNPYAFGTYNRGLDGVRQLASMSQSMLIDADIPEAGWPDRREEDQPIFGNARWRLGPILVDELLYKKAQTPQGRATVLFDQLNQLWTAFFHRAALIELELWVRTGVAAGSPPTGKEISAQYLALLRNIDGPEEQGLLIDEVYGREWVTEGTLFFGQHQLGFLASDVAAVAIAEGLQSGDTRIVKAMRHIRGRNLEYSHDFLLSMGIDLTSPQPYAAYVARMQRKMDELDRELQRLNL